MNIRLMETAMKSMKSDTRWAERLVVFLILVFAGVAFTGLPAPSDAGYAVGGATVETAAGVRLELLVR